MILCYTSTRERERGIDSSNVVIIIEQFTVQIEIYI